MVESFFLFLLGTDFLVQSEKLFPHNLSTAVCSDLATVQQKITQLKAAGTEYLHGTFALAKCLLILKLSLWVLSVTYFSENLSSKCVAFESPVFMMRFVTFLYLLVGLDM